MKAIRLGALLWLLSGLLIFNTDVTVRAEACDEFAVNLHYDCPGCGANAYTQAQQQCQASNCAEACAGNANREGCEAYTFVLCAPDHMTQNCSYGQADPGGGYFSTGTCRCSNLPCNQ